MVNGKLFDSNLVSSIWLNSTQTIHESIETWQAESLFCNYILQSD